MSAILQYHTTISPDDLKRNAALKYFFEKYTQKPIEERNILEIGTKRWYSHSTHHKSVLEPYTHYTMTDVEGGDDVDVVRDLHTLYDDNGLTYDVIWCSSVFEHLHSPWVAAEQILKSLKPGGIFFIQTHQTFPIHGYPNFYFTFSTEAMKHLFRGASETVASYDHACTITPHNKQIDWNAAAPSWLNVCIAGSR